MAVETAAKYANPGMLYLMHVIPGIGSDHILDVLWSSCLQADIAAFRCTRLLTEVQYVVHCMQAMQSLVHTCCIPPILSQL